MGYIIVWRNRHREPHIDVNSLGFKEEYMTFDDGKKAAEEILAAENENNKSQWYFDYGIYEEVER